MKRHIKFRNAVYKIVSNSLPDFEDVWAAQLKKYPNLLRESQEFAEEYKDYIDFEKMAEKEGRSVDEVELEWERDPYVTPEALKDRFEDLYDDLVHDLRYIAGKEIWRAMRLPIETDPATVDPLGIYWSRTEAGAESYWGWKTEGQTQDIVFLVEAPPLKDVDIPGTLEANMIPEFGAEEREVRLQPGAKLYLVSYTLPDGKEVPVKEWRTA